MTGETHRFTKQYKPKGLLFKNKKQAMVGENPNGFDIVEGSRKLRSLKGLSNREAARRKKQGLVNKSPDFTEKKIRHILMKNIFSLFNMLYFTVAAGLLAVKSYKDLLFLGVTFLNMIIGIVQEIRAKKLLEKLSLVGSQVETVVRDGKVTKTHFNELVMDDIVILRASQQVMADCIVRYGHVEVNEAMVTGESECVTKKIGDVLISGSFIVSDLCYAQVVNVGAENYINKMTADAKKYKKYDSEMIKAIRLVVKSLSFVIIPLGAMLFYSQYGSSHDLLETTTKTATAVLSMIPEGFVLLTSVALMTGAIRLSREKVLIQELYGLETLSKIDVICLDKTGTITENDLKLLAVESCSSQLSLKLIDVIIANMVNGLADVTNQTFCSLKAYILQKGINTKTFWKVKNAVRFSSQKKWSGVTFEKFGTFVMGAPEIVLKEKYGKYKEKIEGWMNDGNRVIALVGSKQELITGKNLIGEISPIAIFVFHNALRTNAGMMISLLQERGAKIKILSGDNPLTVSQIAKKAGVAGSDRYIDASNIPNSQRLTDVADKYTVFGRLKPDQKRDLIKFFKEKQKVAMIGDGVNDVLALKEADCGVSFADASPPAKHVSQVILMEGDISLLSNVIIEGQRILNNIQRAGAMFLSKTGFSVLLTIILTFWHKHGYPFSPRHLTLVNAFTIGIPSFILSFEESKEVATGKFLTNIITKAIPGAITMVIGIISTYLCSGIFELTHAETLTLCVFIVAFLNLSLLHRISYPMDKLRKRLWYAMIVGFVATATIFKNWLNLTYSIRLAVIFLVWSVISLLVFKSLFKLTPKIEKFAEKWES
ncbi:MAG: HAD-IC family P-type ATPase [Oscillospiraceae bacterium]|jgi:cation-transporting ATPase E|nr:HAD-IC family P-type ATPase [Oscillospiraceae bacterium]